MTTLPGFLLSALWQLFCSHLPPFPGIREKLPQTEMCSAPFSRCYRGAPDTLGVFQKLQGYSRRSRGTPSLGLYCTSQLTHAISPRFYDLIWVGQVHWQPPKLQALVSQSPQVSPLGGFLDHRLDLPKLKSQPFLRNRGPWPAGSKAQPHHLSFTTDRLNSF